MRRGLIGGVTLAVLWFACGWASYLLQSGNGSLATLGRLLPSPMVRGVFGNPLPWALIVQLLMAVALVTGFAAISSWLGRGPTSLAVAWLAGILTAFAIGAALDAGNLLVWIGRFGVASAVGTMGATPLTVWWAVLVGWIPALVAVRSESGTDAAPARRAPTIAVVLFVLAVIALPLAAQAGDAATQQQLQQEQDEAQAQADPDGAAAPDPSAVGDPVPTAAPAEGAIAADACTGSNTTILAPTADAATGHRAQALSVVNTSDAPCVVDGYPDVAFGDQNGHLLDVATTHGRSFMAEDPGPTPITLQPGEAASAVIGWDANSVQGQLAARSLWVAVRSGAERLRWDVVLDLIPGATVHVTAWHTAPPR